MTLRRFTVLVLVCLLGAAVPASAELKLPAIFGSNMVLQAESPVPVWGWADKGAKITVAFAAQSASATAGSDGKWTATLKAMKASARGRTLIVTSSIGNGKLEIGNVLVGEVWICSGQSNMSWSVRQAVDAEAEAAAATYPNLRLFTVPRRPAASPKDDCVGAWSPCTSSW